MKTIKIQLPKSHLDTYKQCAKDYKIDLKELMEAQGFLQLECLDDSLFSQLERFEEYPTGNGSLECFSISYNERTTIFIERVAELLRRSPSEVMEGCLSCGAESMAYFFNDLKNDPNDEMAKEILEEHAESTAAHVKAAQFGSMVKGVGGRDQWENFHIKRPTSLLTKPTAA